MYDKFKEIAEVNEWKFFYARRDFLNLEADEGEEEKIHLMVDPIVIQNQFDEYGSPDSKLYSGHFMILMSSQFDDGSYEDRYNKYIKPLVEQAERELMEGFSCSDFTLTFWQSVEIINAFDFNYDGLIINYQISK